jgi:predicted HAD superfamily Cof-like phosphohydrolase
MPILVVMINVWQDIKDFHAKYGLTYEGPPRQLSEELQRFRLKFIEEEFKELVNSSSNADQLDACCDLVYVILGYAYLRGWNFDEAWRRVHSANMKKIRAASAHDSKRQTAFDVVKPPGWKPPRHEDLVGDPLICPTCQAIHEARESFMNCCT